MSKRVVEGLAERFLRLTPKQFGNLLWHVKRGTPILCGKKAYLFTSASGGG